jgi:uncharacterized membrane protein
MYFKKWLLYTIVVILLLTAFRIFITSSLTYIFLPWNLFLAYTPFAISNYYFSKMNSNLSIPKYQFIALFIIWLLLLPNAPYITTDLMHLHQRPPIPFYFDIMFLFIYALLGILFFIASVYQMELLYKKYFSKKSLFVFYGAAFFLCSFGIYLGRYLRFNSWDIIHKPLTLMSDIAQRFIFPFDHTRTWGVTLLYSISLFLLYQLIKNFKTIDFVQND